LKIVWATHRDLNAHGGAEFCDLQMLNRRPLDMNVTLVNPGFSKDPFGNAALMEADRVVLTSTYPWSPEEVLLFSRKHPLIWLHDMDYVPHHPVFAYAEDVVYHTDWQKDRKPFWTPGQGNWPRAQESLCPGWFDVSPWDGPVSAAHERGMTALWAHRAIWHKGLDAASQWAVSRGYELRVMMLQPRSLVIEAMKESNTFVLLSLIDDPGPLAVIEAQLSGCEIKVNEHVGTVRFPDDLAYEDQREWLKQHISEQDVHFWNLVRGGA
jgi:hypothetical protein